MHTSHEAATAAHAPPRGGAPPGFEPRATAALDALRARPRFNSDAKLVGEVLLDYVRRDRAGILFPSDGDLSARCGFDHARDKGKARVRRALAALEAIGFLGRVAPGDFDDWYDRVGRPKLDLIRPGWRRDPKRILVLWGKFPGVAPEGCLPPLYAQRRGSGRCADVQDREAPAPPCPTTPGGAGAPVMEAPAPPVMEAPAPPLRTCSKLEHDNVSAARAPGGSGPSAPVGGEAYTARTPRPVEAILADLGDLDRREIPWRKIPLFAAGLLWGLQDGGHPLPDLRRPMPRRPDLETEAASAPPGSPATTRPPTPPPKVLAPTTEDLVRVLAGPCTDADVERAAQAVTVHLDDPGWRNYHRKTMADVRAKALTVKVVIAALRQVRDVAPGSRPKIYADAIRKARGAIPEQRRKEPRPGHPEKFPAGVAKVPTFGHYTVSR